MKHILAAVVAVALVWSFLPSKVTAPVVAPANPVTAALSPATRQDKARVAAFYSALADVVERDGTVASTVGGFRTLHSRSLDLAFNGTDLPGKYRGLDVAINDLLVKAVGADDVPLPPARRQDLVQALKDVANAAR
jgi:ABC-type amino acid transport substrate-binding protein